GPGKGLEHAIQAMPAILKAQPTAKLYIVGQTHPVIMREQGEKYRESLIALAKKLHISRSVIFVNEYLDNDKLRRYYQAAAFVITAYKALEQSGSGTLAWALGAGKVCISTPYNYAKEVLANDTGVFVQPGSADDIATQVTTICSDPKRMLELRKRAYAK